MRKAFTLVETLCVLGIIAIVAAISFPVFAAVRRSSKKAVSMSNLRQVYLQTEMYRSDHDGDGRWGSTYAMGLPPSSGAMFGSKSEVINSPFAPKANSPMLGKQYYQMFWPDSQNEKWSLYSAYQTVNSVFWVDPFMNTDPYPLTMDVEISRTFLFVNASGHVGVKTLNTPWDRLGSWITEQQ